MRRTFMMLVGLLLLNAFLGFGGMMDEPVAHVGKILFYVCMGFLLVALLLGAYHEEH